MTNLELQNLENSLDQVNQSITELEKQNSTLYTRANESKKKVLESFINGYGDDDVRFSANRIDIYPSTGNWELATIYVKDNWGAKGTEYTDMYMSVGSFRTETMEEWVVERFQKLTYYAQVVVDFKDDILARFNQIEVERDQEQDKFIPQLKELRAKGKELNEAISDEKERRKLEMLSTEGVEFKAMKREGWDGETYEVYPDFDAKFNERWNGVRGIKILRTSTSGKSADVSITIKGTKYNVDGTIEKTLMSQDVMRVRMENILKFVNRNETVA